MVSIYSPEVRREAQLFGITDLQAWRKINAREALRERERKVQSLDIFYTRGIDAYNRGEPRSANPYSYEASRSWDSGWMHANEAHRTAHQSR